MMVARVWIRSFRSVDAQAVSGVCLRNVWEILVRDYEPGALAVIAAGYAPEQIAAQAAQRLMLVAEVDGQVVGTAVLDQDRVRDVHVDVDYQRQGVGRTLMAAIEDAARRQGQPQLYLLAAVSAVAFYEKLGYVVVKTLVNDVGGHPLPVVYMEKTLIL